jgi:hypothetical protein
MDEGFSIAGRVLDRMFRPTFQVGLKSMKAIVQLQPTERHAWRTDAQLDVVFIQLPGAPLTSAWLEPLDIDAQRLARLACRAARTEQHPAEATPARLEAHGVFRGREVDDHLVLKAPLPIGQIPASARRRNVTVKRLHAGYCKGWTGVFAK